MNILLLQIDSPVIQKQLPELLEGKSTTPIGLIEIPSKWLLAPPVSNREVGTREKMCESDKCSASVGCRCLTNMAARNGLKKPDDVQH
jgi:hypothetical protein